MPCSFSDLADWLGVGEIGLFNFKPSVRPVPIEVHIQVSFISFSVGRYARKPSKEIYWLNLVFAFRVILESITAQGWIAWTSQHTQLSAPIHLQNLFLSLFHRVDRQGLPHWILFRYDLSSNSDTSSSSDYIILIFIIFCIFFYYEIKFAASDEHPRQFLSVSEEDLQMVLSQITDQNLRHTLQFGIGLHHAGLNDQDRSVVEELFVNNKIQALSSTYTLSVLTVYIHDYAFTFHASMLMLIPCFHFRFWSQQVPWHGEWTYQLT